MDRALAHLGVHRDDAEVEVLEEPKSGMFGRVKGEARVRARVRPSGPRPKRSRRSGERSDRPRNNAGRAERPRTEKKQGDEGRREKEKAPRATTATKSRSSEKSPVKEDSMAEGITLAEQGAIAKEFLTGLLASMEIKAEVSVKELDEETVELSVNANPPTELGVLVGPRGTTLQALQEVTRTVVQSKSPVGPTASWLTLRNTVNVVWQPWDASPTKLPLEVAETGEERALEPMSAADRKAVHDALSEDEKVVTRSEGEEPRRFVVVSPA